MTIRKLVIWITFLAIFAMAARVSIVPDTWWHLSAGRWMIENRTLIQTEPFSYTRAGVPWQYPGLWFEVLMYWIYQAFGPGGLNILTALLITATYAVLWRVISGGVLLRAFMLIASATVSAVYWAARPYLVSFLLAAVFLWVLDEYHHQRRDRTWILPLLMIIWANSHGGFVVGFILVGIFWFERVTQSIINRIQGNVRAEVSQNVIRLTLILVMMAGAVAINPEGFDRWSLPFTTVGRNAERTLIAEWQSPDFHSVETQPFAIIFLLSFGILGLSGLGMTLLEFLLMSVFAYMGFISGRNIPLFSLAFPLVFIRHLEPLSVRIGTFLGVKLRIDDNVPPPKLLGMLNIFLLLLIVMGVFLKISLILPANANWKYLAATYPVDAVQHLEQKPPEGRLFNSYNWGGYITWALPEEPVYIDGRADLYGDEMINQWLKVVSAGEGWDVVLNQWQVSTVIVEPNWPVSSYLHATGWRLIHEDDVAVVFAR